MICCLPKARLHAKLVFMSQELPNFEFVSWQQMHRLCFELSRKIKESDREFDTIVSISRGGHIPSRMLSDFLGLPIFSVTIQSYKEFKQGKLEITQKLGMFLEGQNVLVVDEIADSGKTLERAIGYLTKLRATSVATAVVCVKPQSNPKPDFFGSVSSYWVIFPYEVRETITSVWSLWKEAGKDVGELVEMLVAGGFEREQIDSVIQDLV